MFSTEDSHNQYRHFLNIKETIMIDESNIGRKLEKLYPAG